MGTSKRKKIASRLTRVCAAAVCAAFLTVFAGSLKPYVYASSALSDRIKEFQDRIDEITKENKDRQSQIDSLGGDISSNKSAMSMVSSQIDGIKEEINVRTELINLKMEMINEKELEIEAVELSIADKEQAIDDKKVEIAGLEKENKENLEKFAKLARVLYMNDTSGTIPVLNGSDDWYSYFVYSDVVRNISGQNVAFMQRLMDSIKAQEALIDAMNDEIARLEQDKIDLQTQKQQFEEEKAALEDEKQTLSAEAQEKYSYLSGLTAQNQSLQSQVNSLKSGIEEGNEEIEQLNRDLEQLIYQLQHGNSGQEVYSDGFRWPLESKFRMITTNFGYDPWRGGNHYGIDVGNAGIGGHNIYAAQSGTVILVSQTCNENYGKSYKDTHGGGYGNYIVIDHGGGISTLYAHCATIYYAVGQHVNKGDIIGIVGSTGWSTGFHLHFEVRVNSKAVNPFNYSYQYV